MHGAWNDSGRLSPDLSDAVRSSAVGLTIFGLRRARPTEVSAEVALSRVLSEFARTMLTDFPIQGILDHLVGRIVDILPIDAAGVTVIRPGAAPHYIAASNEAALRYEELQSELDEGPCLLAYASGEPVAIPDLRQEKRFPVFAPRALAAGLNAAFTFPLRHGDLQLGALDLYRHTPGGLSPDAMTAAQTLADVAAAYLLNAQARVELQDKSEFSRQASLHDPLTGLPNRVLILERLEQAFARSRRTGKATAVLFIDLDQFKTVNDAHGHRLGDDLLVGVGKRLSGLLRPHDTLGRLSGDEFVVLCEDLDTVAQAAAIAARLAAAFAQPFRLSDVDHSLTASIGVTLDHRNERTPAQLLHDADTAMYEAKRQGGARAHIFRVDQPSIEAETGREVDLAAALDRGELYTVYQPIVSTASGRISGFEALLRWRHPTHGLIPPAMFIPLAEQSGLILELGQWVLTQAGTDLHRWRMRLPGSDFTMSVNVSAHQLMAPGFTEMVGSMLRSTETDPRFLTLEVTESIFISDSDRALVILCDLKKTGVQLALDDFGTGYSSLSYLSQFPVDIVKIDRSFVDKLGQDASSRVIIGAVNQLAHGLGMTVIAEGIETEEQHRDVAELGCDLSQGFYFAKPMTTTNIDTLLHHHFDGADLHLPVAPTPATPPGDVTTAHPAQPAVPQQRAIPSPTVTLHERRT